MQQQQNHYENFKKENWQNGILLTIIDHRILYNLIDFSSWKLNAAMLVECTVTEEKFNLR